MNSQIKLTLIFKYPVSLVQKMHFTSEKVTKLLIIYNDSLPMNRLRFTLAHEYGHFVMGHTGINLNEHFTYRTFTEEKLKNMKQTVLHHACCFLLHIRYQYLNCLDINKISKVFQISVQSSEIALKVIKSHMNSGLDNYMSSNENLHPKTIYFS